MVTPHEWDALADEALALEPGDQVALGFDGSKSDDHTALIAARIDDGAWFTPRRVGSRAAPRRRHRGT